MPRQSKTIVAYLAKLYQELPDPVPAFREISRATGVSASAVHAVLTGKTIQTSLDTAIKLGGYFGMAEDEVLTHFTAKISTPESWSLGSNTPKVCLVLQPDGAIHSVVIADERLAERRAQAIKGLILTLWATKDFRE